MRVLSCNSPYGHGGMGQHFAHLVEASRRAGQLDRYYTPVGKEGDPYARPTQSQWARWLMRYTPLRAFPTWRTYISAELYDRAVAAALVAPPERFMGFAGESLQSFRRARTLGTERLELVSATSHVANVARRHEQAIRETGFAQSWLNSWLLKKTLREYDLADHIYVHSEYTRQSFLEAGIPPEKLSRTHLTADARFRPPVTRSEDGIFRVVYVGRVDATKGISLLVEAFSRLAVPQSELILVGGWSSRAMHQYIEDWMRRDPRIHVRPGDPLPVLQRASVFVNPSYEDGFGYAPLEALACGVPVVVTEDTGMKEYLVEGETGCVFPTGDGDALLDELIRLHQTWAADRAASFHRPLRRTS